MQFITRPLIDWPRPKTPQRTKGGYAVGYARSLDLLEKELEHLRVKGDVVIQLDMPEVSIRRDGLPYSDKRPNSPRVAISFTGKHGAMVYRCDAHHGWQENIRAISLGLQRLRLVEETGITSRGEQYTGFIALPPGIEMPAAMTVEAAARIVATGAGTAERWEPMVTAVDTFKTMYRAGCQRLHPDAGDRPEQWVEFQRAAEVLKRHHKIA